MPRNLKIEHLLTVKTYPNDVEVNFSYSNMEFLLTDDELPFARSSIQLQAFPGDARGRQPPPAGDPEPQGEGAGGEHLPFTGDEPGQLHHLGGAAQARRRGAHRIPGL